MEENISNKEYCQSCGAELNGKFCSNCGEKKFDRKDLTFKKIILQFIDGLTHFDSKILSSVKLLITKPGLLAKEYCSGARVKYAKPLQMFFIINVVFFIMLSFATINTFTTPLSLQMNTTKHRELATSMVEHKLDKENIQPVEYEKRLEEYSKKFDVKVNLYSKSLIIIIAPLFAFILYIVFINKRRLYVESFIFSLNFLSWLLLINIALQLLMLPFKFTHTNIQNYLTDEVISPIIFTIIGVHFYFGAMRFYEEKKMLSLLKAIFLPYLFINVIHIYRFILFLITYYST